MPKTPATLPGVHTRKQRTKQQIKKEKHITKKKSTYKQQMKERRLARRLHRGDSANTYLSICLYDFDDVYLVNEVRFQIKVRASVRATAVTLVKHH